VLKLDSITRVATQRALVRPGFERLNLVSSQLAQRKTMLEHRLTLTQPHHEPLNRRFILRPKAPEAIGDHRK
jgi:hypothetical protein